MTVKFRRNRAILRVVVLPVTRLLLKKFLILLTFIKIFVLILTLISVWVMLFVLPLARLLLIYWVSLPLLFSRLIKFRVFLLILMKFLRVFLIPRLGRCLKTLSRPRVLRLKSSIKKIPLKVRLTWRRLWTQKGVPLLLMTSFLVRRVVLVKVNIRVIGVSTGKFSLLTAWRGRLLLLIVRVLVLRTVLVMVSVIMRLNRCRGRSRRQVIWIREKIWFSL